MSDNLPIPADFTPERPRQIIASVAIPRDQWDRTRDALTGLNRRSAVNQYCTHGINRVTRREACTYCRLEDENTSLRTENIQLRQMLETTDCRQPLPPARDA